MTPAGNESCLGPPPKGNPNSNPASVAASTSTEQGTPASHLDFQVFRPASILSGSTMSEVGDLAVKETQHKKFAGDRNFLSLSQLCTVLITNKLYTTTINTPF